MPRLKNQLPKMGRHKASGQATVYLDNKCHYLGPYGSDEARERYDRLIAGWIAGRRAAAPASGADLTVGGLLIRFLRHADEYYRDQDGKPTGEAQNLRDACRPLNRLYGTAAAAGFTPADLGAVRASMEEAGLARSTINDRVKRIRRVFAWGVARGLVPETVHRALGTLAPLKKGRSAAREAPRIRAVDVGRVTATLPFLSPVVAAMVKVQLLSGCRLAEATILRPCDIRRDGDVWEYRPRRFKGDHREQPGGEEGDRVIFLGERAQEVLRPLLEGRPNDAYVFDPREVVEDLRRRRVGGRPSDTVARRYDRRTYRQAFVRACDRAFPHPTLAGIPASRLTAEQRDELRAWRRRNRWSPLQLRKARATEVRKLFGLEASQVVLGHTKADVSELYAERDREKARDVMREIG